MEQIDELSRAKRGSRWDLDNFAQRFGVRFQFQSGIGGAVGGGIGGGYSPGGVNIGYQWGGPTNVGIGAGPFNTGLAPIVPQFQMPVFTNTMGGGPGWGGTPSSPGAGPYTNTMAPESWNMLAASTRANQPSNLVAGGTGTLYGALGGTGGIAGGQVWNPNSPLARMANPGAGTTLWDPNNTAYNMLYGGSAATPGIFGSVTNPSSLGYSNINRMFQMGTPYWGPNASAALAATSAAETGGNPFAMGPQTVAGDPNSRAMGGFQWLTPSRFQGANAFLGAQGGMSPESQMWAAMNEITGAGAGGGGWGRGFPGVASTLGSPNATPNQMISTLVNQYEAPGPVGGTAAAGDIGRATSAFNTLMQNNISQFAGGGGGRGGTVAPAVPWTGGRY